MSDFITSFNKATKLVESKQNSENAIALIGTDKVGDESFLQWIDSSMVVSELNIPNNICRVHAIAGQRL